MQAVIQSKLAEDIDKYLNMVTEDKEELIVTRENGTSVVVMDLDEYNSLLETVRIKERAERALEALYGCAKGEKLTEKLLNERRRDAERE